MIAVAAFAGALVSGPGGVGGAFIIVIGLTPVVGAKSVIPLIAVYAIWANISRVLIYWRTITWKAAFQFSLASLPGIYLGTRFLKENPETVFLGFMGGVLIAISPARRHLERTAFAPGLTTIVTLGFPFGFMSEIAADSDMLVIAFFKSIGLSGPLLGTDAVIGLVNALTQSGMFYGLGPAGSTADFAGPLHGLGHVSRHLCCQPPGHAYGHNIP